MMEFLVGMIVLPIVMGVSFSYVLASAKTENQRVIAFSVFVLALLVVTAVVR